MSGGTTVAGGWTRLTSERAESFSVLTGGLALFAFASSMHEEVVGRAWLVE